MLCVRRGSVASSASVERGDVGRPSVLRLVITICNSGPKNGEAVLISGINAGSSVTSIPLSPPADTFECVVAADEYRENIDRELGRRLTPNVEVDA